MLPNCFGGLECDFCVDTEPGTESLKVPMSLILTTTLSKVVSKACF